MSYKNRKTNPNESVNELVNTLLEKLTIELENKNNKISELLLEVDTLKKQNILLIDELEQLKKK
jgi:hypothetical protein